MSGDSKNRTSLPGSQITRRQALQLTFAAGISATSITLAVTDPAEAAAAGPFLHGVASGDPRSDRVVIWTRITQPGATESIPVIWEIAEDRAMTRIVKRGGAAAGVNRDFTVKVDVTGLQQGHTYYYRFRASGKFSQTGRTRTLPSGNVRRLKFAVFSCSNYELGFFNPYTEAAKHDDLDAVLHLGDYIYEYGRGGYQTPIPGPREAELVPAEEIITLDQYRARHALYRTDAHLQKLHRDNPFINIWDDHEVANDAWVGGAENHNAGEGKWQKRKKAGIRAFYEWLPIREPADGRPVDEGALGPDDLYRVFDFGNLARLVMIDTRQAGRDEQLGVQQLVAAYATAQPNGTFPADVTAKGVTRTLLGKTQQNWFAKRMAESTQTWQLIGNQVLMFYQNAPDILGTPLLSSEQKQLLINLLDQVLGAGAGSQLAQLGAAGLPSPLAADAWTGYPTARLKMLQALAQAANPIVLTGDSHNAWTANLALPTGGDPLPVGPEFGGTSVTSPGFEEYLVGVPPQLVSGLLVDSSERKSPTDKLIYMDASKRGFMLVEVTSAVVTVDHVFVSTVRKQAYAVETVRFRVPVGSREAAPVHATTTAKAG